MGDRCFRWRRLEYSLLCVYADQVATTIDDYDSYYATMTDMSMDSMFTVTVTMTIIEDIYLDCSIVQGSTLCTTASTSIHTGDSSDDAGYGNHSEPTPTQGYGSY